MGPWPSAFVRRLLMWLLRISMFEPEEVWVLRKAPLLYEFKRLFFMSFPEPVLVKMIFLHEMRRFSHQYGDSCM